MNNDNGRSLRQWCGPFRLRSQWVQGVTLSPPVVGALVLSLLVCSGCQTIGKPVVDPERPFAGLRDVLNDLPDDGTLEIFLAHGMRVDEPPQYTGEIEEISKRLNLARGPDKVKTDPTKPLVSNPPNISLDGVPVFGPDSKYGSDWATFQPRVTVKHTQTLDGKKHVNFYLFEYWQALAFIKCQFIIAPDTRVIGITDRSKYCAKSPWSAPGADRLSIAPAFGNQLIKDEIMEWGLSDAVIAISQYRSVLHQAVREALILATDDARAAAQSDANIRTGAIVNGAPAVPNNFRYRFAFITESLGSYVISDALSTFVTPNAPDPTLDPDATIRDEQFRAVRLAVCGATQVHMLANQLALLRMSELSIATASVVSMTNAETATSTLTLDSGRHAHFFRGCTSDTPGTANIRNGVSFGARQVVAYHEPNDLLSYYTSDKPGFVGSDNKGTTNVVIQYAPTWIPFLFHDAITAHTGQPKVPAIMDMLSCGHREGVATGCAHP